MQLLPALEAGGVERGTLEIASALVEAGHRAIVVSRGGRLVDELTALGAVHETLDIGTKSPMTWFRAGALARLMQRHGVDVVHARSRLPAWLAWRALSRIAPRPHFVTTLHGLNSVNRYSRIMTRGDRVIAVSESCAAYWLEHYPGLDPQRVEIIHRGIDPAKFPHGYRPEGDWLASFRQALAVPETRKLLCLPGRITRLKGHATLIDQLEVLTNAGVDVQALMVGDVASGKERYRDELIQNADQRGVSDRITWTGHRSDVRDIMAVSDVVLSLSSRPESFGRTVAEALALGRPVAGWDRGGTGEILNRIYPAGAVPADDGSALTETLKELLHEPPPVPDEQPFRLAEMRTRTLALYESLARAA